MEIMFWLAVGLGALFLYMFFSERHFPTLVKMILLLSIIILGLVFLLGITLEDVRWWAAETAMSLL
jgi:hypothetical protein